ncbi:hypothetical protein [Confluentibacter sediminis]|uniref:hypothetical protein n=1 Tax=Confluentibacter sediminis TaxID=2219045 RepID=UPI0013A69498|nr:hypothetical protein [Confluentibacter sediminis]
MEHKEKEDFEFVKEKNEEKGNYIFKKDSITKTGFYIIAIILIALIGITIYYGTQVTE